MVLKVLRIPAGKQLAGKGAAEHRHEVADIHRHDGEHAEAGRERGLSASQLPGSDRLRLGMGGEGETGQLDSQQVSHADEHEHEARARQVDAEAPRLHGRDAGLRRCDGAAGAGAGAGAAGARARRPAHEARAGLLALHSGAVIDARDSGDLATRATRAVGGGAPAHARGPAALLDGLCGDQGAEGGSEDDEEEAGACVLAGGGGGPGGGKERRGAAGEEDHLHLRGGHVRHGHGRGHGGGGAGAGRGHVHDCRGRDGRGDGVVRRRGRSLLICGLEIEWVVVVTVVQTEW